MIQIVSSHFHTYIHTYIYIYIHIYIYMYCTEPLGVPKVLLTRFSIISVQHVIMNDTMYHAQVNLVG